MDSAEDSDGVTGGGRRAGTQIEVGSTPTHSLTRDTATRPRPSYAHLDALLAGFAATPADDPRRRELRDALVVGHLPLVRSIARRYAHRGEAQQDLEQVGTIGLLSALERFDPAVGVPFVSFAVPTITGEIRHHFRDKTWSLKVPRLLKELQGPVREAVLALTTELGRGPRPSEIAEHLGLPVADVVDALTAAQAYAADSLDDPGTSSEFGARHPELIRDDSALETVEHNAVLRAALRKLSPIEREIVLLRFYGDMSQTEIAARVGLSQMHISRLLARSLARMRAV